LKIDKAEIVTSKSSIMHGSPYNNALAGSFFSTAKRECIYQKEYVTIDEVKRDLPLPV
jgi:hypothetical protein